MNLPLTYRKATQALNFLARQSGGSINKLKALKLLFFADRYHLRKYGRPVSECSYFAMNHGPVASEAKQVAEDHDLLPAPARSYAHKFLKNKSDYDFASIADVDKSVLSESDLEALTFAWENFGYYFKYQLRNITHHYPEWKRHERALGHDGRRRVKMDYADFFAEPDAGFNPCHALTAKEREVARALFLERQAFDQRWS
ncbi:MAG: Panacea domain-containing protein [Kiritimatiellaeota bacterium]|nr:Panacea domain-containing protein [Kiritimatiellota bacterium]